MDGFILIDKPVGWTSHDICKKISRIFDKAKVGHSGTLDPFATGLLLVAINKATKALLYTDFNYKTYVATLSLGKKTQTGDLTSEVVVSTPIPPLNKEEIIKVLNSFVGESEQTPPMTSAKHFNGVKLYKYAQQGIEVERPSQKIDIKYIKLLSFNENEITFQCLVSSGTYIRVLGEDIASKLGTLGYLSSLRRIAFGEQEQINVDMACSVEEVSIDKISPISTFVTLPKLEVDERIKKSAVFGQNIHLEQCKDDKVLLIHNDEAIAVYKRINDDEYKCERGLWS